MITETHAHALSVRVCTVFQARGFRSGGKMFTGTGPGMIPNLEILSGARDFPPSPGLPRIA